MDAGLFIAAPASGSGKTTVTLALLRALRRRGIAARSFKVGPDYIDPAFHHAASGRECLNLDPWAMREATLQAVLERGAAGAPLAVAEGVMGLFDGAVGTEGSTAEVAKRLGWPVVLVVDAGAMAASAAALVHGFTTFDPDLAIAAVLFNRVGSERHARILTEACAGLGVTVAGALGRRGSLALPSRHLGLVQAGEQPELEAFLEGAADWLEGAGAVDALLAVAAPGNTGGEPGKRAQTDAAPALEPLGARIAIARDDAFSFIYPHVLSAWREAGAALDFFSPLGDEAPPAGADAVYLPGGYPELHAGRLAAARRFREGLVRAAGRGIPIYGECGGYMTLGEGLVDADGCRHRMLGLLPLETSFSRRRLTLGYRRLRLLAPGPLGAAGCCFRGHEFHYATIVRQGDAAPLFATADAAGRSLAEAGLRRGTVAGSFSHLIDRTDAEPCPRPGDEDADQASMSGIRALSRRAM